MVNNLAKALLVMAALCTAPVFSQQVATQSSVPFASSSKLVPVEDLKFNIESSATEITLPTGERIRFDDIDVQTNAGIKTIRARSAAATLLLTTDGVRGYGYVLKDGKQYVIDTVGRNTTITESSRISRPKYVPNGWGNDYVINHDLILEQNQRRAAQGEASAQAQAPSVIDIAFFYDQKLADWFGLQNPRTRAQAAIDYTNAAIAAHNVELELRVVWVGPLSQPLIGDPWATFLSNQDKLDIATDYGADLLHFIYQYAGEPYCGVGSLPGSLAVSGCGTETIAHEIGHNLGLHHDRPNAGHIGTPYADFNYGYGCGNAGTIMAYISPNVPHYSTPLLQNNGDVCGVDIGQPDAAYNGAVFDYTRTDTENWRTPPATVGTVWIDTTGPVSVDEVDAAMPVQITVNRDGDLNEAASVEIGSMENTATTEFDFVEFIERLEFSPGESSKQISINIINDDNYEPVAEDFQVVLRYPYRLDVTGDPLEIQIVSEDLDRGVVAFTDSQIEIDESEGVLQIPVQRSGSAALEHTVDVELVAGTAIPGVDYTDTSGPLTFEIGEFNKTFDVPIIDDDIYDGFNFVDFVAYLTSGDYDYSSNYSVVEIQNDDLNRGQGQFSFDTYYVDENAGSVSIEVERINGNEGPYHFCVRFTFDGTAISGVDYNGGGSTCGPINDGETSRTIPRSVYDNGVADGERYFDIEFYYNDGYGIPFEVGPRTRARVFILDDEAPTGPTGMIQFGAPFYSGNENAGTISVPVSRVGGSFGGAVADFTTEQRTAVSGSDYTDVVGTVSWPNGDAADKVIQIPVIDDDEAEPPETLKITLSGISGATAGSQTSATVTILKSDQPVAPAVEYELVEFLEIVPGGVVIDFEGYAPVNDYIYLGSPGQFSENGVTITNNSQMYVQNNNWYGTDSFLSPQGVDPQIVTITLPPDTTAVGFFYGYYQPVSAVATLDGGQQFVLPANPNGAFEFFSIVRQAPIETIQLVTNGAAIDLDNLLFSGDVEFASDAQLQKCSAVPLPVICAMSDVGGDGLPEIAAAISGSVHVRDTVTGSYVNDIDFGSDPRIAVEMINDIDGNDAPEIAVLSQRASGQVVVTIRDSMTDSVINTIFYGSAYSPVDMAVMPDTDGNGAPELAVLGIDAGNGVRVQARDALSDVATSTTFYGNNTTPTDVQVIPDISGNGEPEIVVHARVNASSQGRMQFRDSMTSVLVRQVFFGSAYAPIKLAVIDDLTGDGVPELAQLARREDTGAVRIQVKNPVDGSTVSNAFTGDTDRPVDIVGTGGMVGMLVEDAGGVAKVIKRDALTGAFSGNVFMGAIGVPEALVVLDDIDGGGDPEFAALGNNAGQRVVQIKDSISGAQINNINLP